VRRLIAVAAGWFVVACASAGQPPGGPEDHDPPVILSVKPDSGQLNVRPGQIDFQFDEVVAQAALGATDLSKLFLVSPRNGDPDVSWHRQRITIKLHGQFRTNTAYVVTMFPGLADLRGNVRKEGATIIFSTGPTIPRFGITGVVFDWAAQHTVPNAYIEAMLRSDTTFKFVGVSDTTGHFEIGPLDTGTYLVRGLIDQNSNHQIDRNEKWDSTVAHVTDVRPAIELDAIERDSTPALLTNVNVDDSVTIHVSFDKYLDPALPLQPALIEVRSADSTRLQVDRVQWAAGFDAAKRIVDSTHKADSLRRVDSLARARDTTRGRGGQPPAAPAAAAPRPPAGIGVPGARPPPPPAKPKALAPDKVVVVTLSPSTPLVPGRSYRITTRGFRNLVGHAAEQTRTFQPPLPKPPPKDTTRARPDSTRPPAGRPPPSKPPH
jgi:hypothetical protein